MVREVWVVDLVRSFFGRSYVACSLLAVILDLVSQVMMLTDAFTELLPTLVFLVSMFFTSVMHASFIGTIIVLDSFGVCMENESI